MNTGRLKKYLAEENIKRNEFARMCDVDPSTVWRWLNGSLEPSKLVIKGLSRLTGIPLKELE